MTNSLIYNCMGVADAAAYIQCIMGKTDRIALSRIYLLGLF